MHRIQASVSTRLTNKCSGILALIYCETSSVTFGGPVTGGAGGGTSGPQSPGGSGGTVGCGGTGGASSCSVQ